MSQTSLPPLLTAQDPKPFTVTNVAATLPLLLVCDHASNYIPPHLRNLGAAPEAIEDHVAWDPGASEVTRRLADELSCTAVFCNYSRLLVDVNRDPAADRKGLIPPISDDYPIPGNQNLTPAQQQQRIDCIHEPYHQAIEQRLNALARLQPAPLLLAIHSFTPMLKGSQQMRPWHAGMLWNADPRMAMPLMEHFRQHDHLVIGDNEPYSARLLSYTIDRHGHYRGFPNCCIEIRQDLLETEENINWWVKHLVDGLHRLLATPGIHLQKYFDLPSTD